MEMNDPTSGPAGTAADVAAAQGEPTTSTPPTPPGNVGTTATTQTVQTAPSSDDPFDTGADTFDRAYVEKLRREAAGYRTKAQPYEEVFGAYDEDEREFLLSVTRDLADPDRQVDAARRLQTLAQRLLEDQDPEGQIERDQPLTLAQLEERERRQAEERAQAEAVAAVEKEATDLGYEKGSPDYAFLMYMAANHHKGSLQDAHKAILDGRQAIIDNYVAEAKAKGDKWLTATDATGGAPAEQGSVDRSWKATRDRAEERAKRAMQQAAG